MRPYTATGSATRTACHAFQQTDASPCRSIPRQTDSGGPCADNGDIRLDTAALDTCRASMNIRSLPALLRVGSRRERMPDCRSFKVRHAAWPASAIFHAYD